jgi:alpha-ketoglutarate-dependent taurine dioxygenase
MKPGTRKMAAIFNLERDEAYLRWREEKLESAPKNAADLLVAVKDPENLDDEERERLLALIRKCNMAVYSGPAHESDENAARRAALAMARQFGLYRIENHRSRNDDGLVAIEKVDNPREGRSGFIPYTDRPISWHTDGYYNPPESRIKAMVLHCARQGADGGENELFDPEIAYIRLRDENPDYIRAFCHRRALAIPPFIENGGVARALSQGPVFTWDRYTGDLHMRFTDRKRNIEWRDDATTREALAFLRHALANDELVIRHRMKPGEGLLCNNVLHTRTGFADMSESGQGRLMLRARFFDRIEGTTGKPDRPPEREEDYY